MPSQKKRLSKSVSTRVEYILHQVAQESPEVRNEIAKSVPAYNSLLNTHAQTFEELALLSVVKKNGWNYADPLFDFSMVKPACPFCGEEEHIRNGNSKKYICSVCKKKYTANHNSISSGTKLSALDWMKVLYCILNFYSIKKTCEYCNITRTTYYAIRTRLFYAMSILLREVKLYGNIQCDNTFVHISYKGNSLQDDDYPEDSPFYHIDYIPREARKRGGGYRNNEKNQNSICIFAAIDEFDHVITRYVCIGAPTSRKLSLAVGDTKILHIVPNSDPFLYGKTLKDIPRDVNTLLIADGEKAIEAFAGKYDLAFESHVYRRDGVQLRLSSDAHNIQKANALHRRLKEFLSKCHYGSTKYLPGFLILFEFIENTGASDAAIGKLFEILAQPNLGMPADHFKELYTIPNYMLEHIDDKDPLKGYSKELCSALYVYHQKRIGEIDINTESLEKQTGYTRKYLQRTYKNFVSSGLMGIIIERYENSKKKKSYEIPHELLQMYDEYAIERRKPYVLRLTQGKFITSMNRKYGTSYTIDNMKYYFKKISELGLRKPLPPFYEY